MHDEKNLDPNAASPPPRQQGGSAHSQLMKTISFEVINHKTSPMLTSQLDEVYVAVAMFFAVFVMNVGLGTIGGMGFAILAGLLLIGAIVWKLWRIRQSGRSLPKQRKDLTKVPGARIVVIGKPQELALLQDLEDVPFEPIIISKIMNMAIYGCLGITLIIVTFVLIFTSPASRRVFGISVLAFPIGLLVSFLWRQAFPTYFRIVPGRLDLIQFNAFTNRRIRFEGWDLRTSDITLDFKKQLLTIVAAKTGKKKEIQLVEAAEPYRLATAVMQAAICSYEAAPLPDDQLLG